MALEVLHATENLVPATGGAERLALEWLGALAREHRVRALWIESADADPDAPPLPGEVEGIELPAPEPGPYWAAKRRRRDAVGAAVAAELERRPADVVVTALHAGPGAVAAGRAGGAATVVVLHSYEALCKYAFDAGSECGPFRDCRGCPRARQLEPGEQAELLASREAHAASLAQADRLVAMSEFAAAACADWAGRRPEVVPAFAGTPPPDTGGDPAGPLALGAARWTVHKGGELLVPLARALAPRALVITERGLTPEAHGALAACHHVELTREPFPALLARARGFLMPSQWPEPFGRTALEAMAAGVPTLASRAGGLPEFVPEAGLVDPPESVEAWAAAAARLDDPAAAEALRAAGREAAARVLAQPSAAAFARVLEAAAAQRV